MRALSAFPRLDLSHLHGDTLRVARRLLGHLLVRPDSDGILVGRIVETEAYRSDDPASHSFRGPTPRCRSMFGRTGLAYVYRIYGIHHCLNVVTEGEGVGAAVLIRALEPIEGHDRMALRRSNEKQLTNGPGRLCQALGIDGNFDGVDLLEGDHLYLAAGRPVADEAVVSTGRIGISQAADLPWRFYERGNPHVSRL